MAKEACANVAAFLVYLSSMLTKIKTTYNEFPVPFWTLMGATFIDRIGGALLYPFFSLYIIAMSISLF